MRSTKEKMSYCIGLQTARQLKNQFAEIDTALLEKGFSDVLQDSTLLLQESEIEALLTSLQQQIQEQQKNQFTQISEENKKQAEEFFKKNKEDPTVHVLASGLQYKVLQAGLEGQESPTAFDVVSIHYRGQGIDGRVFDSSYQRGEPLQIPVAKVIPGWSEVLQLMKPGDKWQVFIPSYLAYGEMGFGSQISPNMALVFEMELLEILQDKGIEL